jgi:hypothetical protein
MTDTAFPEGTAIIYCGGGYYFFCDKDDNQLKPAEKRENSCIIKKIRLLKEKGNFYPAIFHKIQKCKCEPINNLSPQKGKIKWKNLCIFIVWWAFLRVHNKKISSATILTV